MLLVYRDGRASDDDLVNLALLEHFDRIEGAEQSFARSSRPGGEHNRVVFVIEQVDIFFLAQIAWKKLDLFLHSGLCSDWSVVERTIVVRDITLLARVGTVCTLRIAALIGFSHCLLRSG